MTAELVYAEAAEAKRPASLSERQKYVQEVAALIPHRHVGVVFCTVCGLVEDATIHHWDDNAIEVAA